MKISLQGYSVQKLQAIQFEANLELTPGWWGIKTLIWSIIWYTKDVARWRKCCWMAVLAAPCYSLCWAVDARRGGRKQGRSSRPLEASINCLKMNFSSIQKNRGVSGNPHLNFWFFAAGYYWIFRFCNFFLYILQFRKAQIDTRDTKVF